MKLFERTTKRNLKQFQMELARAHMMIAMLAVVVVLFVSLGALQKTAFDPTLSAICVILLIFVTIISLCTSLFLFRKKK
ncbi:hypothetical protein HGB25_01840 [Candidatus Saccharibacteria bacterium]|nr:hypothetical protein [Candidatus Saccharibacteria bacterium]